jgi:transposase
MSENKSNKTAAQLSQKKRKAYAGDFKAKVVVESLKGKKSLADLALEYDLHPNQIKNWRSILLKQAGVVLKDKRRIRNKAD